MSSHWMCMACFGALGLWVAFRGSAFGFPGTIYKAKITHSRLKKVPRTLEVSTSNHFFIWMILLSKICKIHFSEKRKMEVYFLVISFYNHNAIHKFVFCCYKKKFCHQRGDCDVLKADDSCQNFVVEAQGILRKTYKNARFLWYIFFCFWE